MRVEKSGADESIKGQRGRTQRPERKSGGDLTDSEKGKLRICKGAEVRGRVQDEESSVDARGQEKVGSHALGNEAKCTQGVLQFAQWCESYLTNVAGSNFVVSSF